MEQKINKLSRELAWVIGNAIIDSRDEELSKLQLGALIKIREIIETEARSLMKDMIEKKCEINDILDRI